MTRLAPHMPVADPDVPADHVGRPFCRCGVAIVPGDKRHQLPEVHDAQAEVAGRYEHDDGGDA